MFRKRERHFGFDQTSNAEMIVQPTRCLVCHCEGALPFTYIQGHFPIPIPGFGGVYRQTTVTVSYCRQHAEAFQTRFRVLEGCQYAIIVISLACFYAGFILEDRNEGAGNGWKYLVGAGAEGMAGLLPATLVVRRHLYDALFTVRPG